MKLLLLLILLSSCSIFQGNYYERLAGDIEFEAEAIDCSSEVSDCLCRAEWASNRAFDTGMYKNVMIETQQTYEGKNHAFVRLTTPSGQQIDMLRRYNRGSINHRRPMYGRS